MTQNELTPEKCPGTSKCPEINSLGEMNFVDETAWNIAVNDYCGKCEERRDKVLRIQPEMEQLREVLKNWFIDMMQGRHHYPVKGVATTEDLAEWRTDQIVALIQPLIDKAVREEREGI